MKNILAENMLRFGVKNLNESSTIAVKRLITELKNPVTEGPVRTVGTGKKDDPVRQLQSFKCTFNQNGLQQYFSGTCKSTDNGKTWIPLALQGQLLDANLSTQISLSWSYDVATYTFVPTANSNVIEDWTALRYGGPGNIPVNALNAVIAAIQTKAIRTCKIDPAMLTNVKSMRNAYAVKGSSVEGTAGLTGKWFKVEPRDPETDTPTTEVAYIQSEIGATQIKPLTAGLFDKNSIVKQGISGPGKKLNVVASVIKTAAEKGESSGYLGIKSFAGNAGGDTYYLADTIIKSIVQGAGDVLANSSIVSAAEAPKK